MNLDKASHIILSDNLAKDKIFINNDVTNIVDFGNEKELYFYILKKINDKEVFYFLKNDASFSNMLINVAISSSITGYSRIFMSVYKNNPNYKLYYTDTDTDSIFVDTDLKKNKSYIFNY